MNKKTKYSDRLQCSLLSSQVLGERKTQPKAEEGKLGKQITTKQVFIRFDEEYGLEPWEDSKNGWLSSRKENVKQVRANKRQLKGHKRERRKSTGRFEPQYLKQANPKATINYLKSLLDYLRTSTDKKKGDSFQENPVLPVIFKANSATIPMKSESKENQLQVMRNQEPEWLKVPRLPAVRRRKRERQRFTLDKLIG